MKLSIVTISYNQARFLEQCIQSVINQDYPELEYIVVDPGSTDGSREIIERYSDRISKIIFEPDNGPSDGLNKGFRYASGDILGYLNSDDIYLPGTFQKVKETFMKAPDVDVVYGNGFQIDEEGRQQRKIFSNPWNLKRYAYGASVIIQQSTFFHKHAYNKTTGFNTDNKTCWDGELLVDLDMTGSKFFYLNDWLGEFRIYSESITGSNRMWSSYQADKRRIFKKIKGRNWLWLDHLLAVLYRVGKPLRQPILLLNLFNRYKQ